MEKKDTESSLCKKYYDRLLTVWPHFPTVVCATLVFGVLAHGSALFNKYSMVDDPQYLFGMGYTFRSGRWFLGILGSLVRWFTGSPNFSLPLYSGIVCLAVLALCACVLIPLLGFTKKWEWILTAGLMTVFPTVTGYFGFLFTAPYYLVGLLLCLLGCSVLCRYRKWWAYVLGIVLLALSTGIYQAFIPTALCVMLLHFLRKLTLAEKWSWKDLAKDVLWYVSACLAFLALYSLMSRLCLAVTHLTLTGYNGISNPMAGGIRSYVQRIKLAYYLFLIPTGASRTACMFPYRLHTLYYVALALLCLAALLYLRKLWKKGRVRALSGLLALGVFPLAVNFAHVMADPEIVHSLMVYSQVLFWLLPYCLIRWVQPVENRAALLRNLNRLVCALLAVVCLLYVRLDNTAYLKLEIYQTRTIQYFTTLITQIKSLDGYSGDMKVTFVNKDFNRDPTFQEIQELSGFVIEPIRNWESELTAHSFREFLNIWCGFNPEIVDETAYTDLPEVQEMPQYPEAGSIQIVGDTVVVKF